MFHLRRETKPLWNEAEASLALASPCILIEVTELGSAQEAVGIHPPSHWGLVTSRWTSRLRFSLMRYNLLLIVIFVPADSAALVNSALGWLMSL